MMFLRTRQARGLFLNMLLIFELILPMMAGAAQELPFPGTTFGDNPLDLSKVNPSVVTVGKTPYEAMIFDYNYTTQAFTAQRYLSAETLSFECKTGSRNSYLYYTSTDGLSTNGTITIVCGSRQVDQEFERVFYVPATVGILLIHSVYPESNTGDKIIAEVFTELADGNEPVNLGVFPGLLEGSVFTRKVYDYSESGDGENARQPEIRMNRFPHEPKPPKEVTKDSPVTERLKMKPGADGMFKYAQFEGGFYKHVAKKNGLDRELELVTEIPSSYMFAKSSGDRKMMMAESRKARSYYRLSGMDEEPSKEHSTRDLKMHPNGYNIHNVRKGSEGLKRDDGKTIKLTRGLWGEGVPGLKKKEIEEKYANPIDDPAVARSLLKTHYMVVDGLVLPKITPTESTLEQLARTVRDILAGIPTGIVAQQASQGAYISSLGGECGQLNFVTGMLFATTDACQFQAIESLAADQSQLKSDVANLKTGMDLLVQSQLGLVEAQKQTNQIVGLLNDRVSVIEEENIALAKAQADDQYKFADLNAAAAKTSSNIDLLDLKQAKTDASLAQMGLLQDRNNDAMASALKGTALLAEEQFTELQSKFNEQTSFITANDNAGIAQLSLDIMKERLQSVRETTQAYTSIIKIVSGVTHGVNTNIQQISTHLNTLNNQQITISAQIKEDKVAIRSLMQIAAGIGTSAPQYYIMVEQLLDSVISDVTAEGEEVTSGFEMMVVPNGIPPNDKNVPTAQEFTDITITYIDPDDLETCLGSQVGNIVNGLNNHLYETAEITIEIPAGEYPEFMQESYNADITSGNAVAPLSIPGIAPTYFLVGTTVGGVDRYIYYNAGTITSTTDVGLVNEWHIGKISSRDQQPNDALRTGASIAVTISGTSNYYLVWDDTNTLEISTTPSDRVFWVEQISDAMKLAIGVSANSFRNARDLTYLNGTILRQDSNQWLRPILIEDIDNLYSSPLDYIRNTADLIVVDGLYFSNFRFIFSSVPLLNDTGITEIILTDSTRNATTTPVKISRSLQAQEIASALTKRSIDKEIKQAEEEQHVRSETKKRQVVKKDTVASFDECYDGILENAAFYTAPGVNGPSGMQTQFHTCAANPKCMHVQGLAQHYASITDTSGVITYQTGQFSYDSANQLATISSIIISPQLTLKSQTVLPGTAGTSSNNYHCATMTGRCYYAIPVNTCSGPGGCSDRATYCSSTKPNFWSTDSDAQSGLDNSAYRTVCGVNPTKLYCTYTDAADLVAVNSYRPQTTVREGITSDNGRSINSNCKKFQFVPSSGKTGFLNSGSYATGTDGLAGGNMDCFIGNNVQTGITPHPNRPIFVTKGHTCTKCETGYGYGSTNLPVPGKTQTTGACPINSGASTTLIGDHTGTYFISGASQPNGTVGAVYTAALTSPIASYWSACVPRDITLKGIASSANNVRQLSFNYFFTDGDIGPKNYSTPFDVKIVAFSCGDYTAAECTTTESIRNHCKTRVSVDRTLNPGTNFKNYERECVEASIPSRCNFTNSVACITYSSNNPSGIPVPLCVWSGSLESGSCREVESSTDPLELAISASLPTPRISIACSLRQDVAILGCTSCQTASLASCAHDNMCFVYIPGDGSILNTCLPVANPLAIDPDTFTYPSSQGAALSLLTSLGYGTGVSGFTPNKCLLDNYECLSYSSRRSLRFYEILTIAYPGMPVKCSLLSKYDTADVCLMKSLAFNIVSLTGDTADHVLDNVVSKCEYRTKDGVSTGQCVDKCAYIGRDKNVDACLATANCLTCKDDLRCFDSINSEGCCPGRSTTRTAPDSSCIGSGNICGLFRANAGMNGVVANFTTRGDFLGSECSIVAGPGCGNFSRYQEDPRLNGAILPSGIDHKCVVRWTPPNSICQDKALTPWCGLGSPGCSEMKDVCSTNSTADIAAVLTYMATQGYCEIHKDIGDCLLTKTDDQESSPANTCVSVEAVGGFFSCTTEEQAFNEFGTLDPPVETGIVINTRETYLQRNAQLSTKNIGSPNRFMAVGININDIVVPPVGQILNRNDPAYAGKILMIENPTFPCADPTRWESRGQMCCPIGATFCDNNNVIYNTNYQKNVFINQAHEWCPTMRFRRSSNEKIYSACSSIYFASSSDTSVAASESYQCIPMVSPTLARAMFQKADLSDWETELVAIHSNVGGVDDIQYMELVPLKNYRNSPIVGNVTIPMKKMPGTGQPGYLVRNIYATNAEAEWIPLTGVTVPFLGNTLEFDVVLNVTMNSRNVRLEQFDIMRVKEEVTAKPTTGWKISTLTAGAAFRYNIDLTRKTYIKSQANSYSDSPITWNVRIPTGCLSVLRGPGTTYEGDYTLKENHFFCSYYQNRWFPVYMVVNTVVSYTTHAIISTDPNTKKLPASVTIEEKTPSNFLEKGEFFVFQEDEDVQFGAVSDNPQAPYDWAYIWSKDPDNFDPVAFMRANPGFDPRLASNSPSQTMVRRNKNASKFSPLRFCGGSIQADGSGTTQTLDSIKSRLQYDAIVAFAENNTAFPDSIVDRYNNILITSNLPVIDQRLDMLDDAGYLEGCTIPFRNFIDPITNSTDFFTKVDLLATNQTTGEWDFDIVRMLMRSIASGRDHILCGNCILRIDPVTQQPIYQPDNPNIKTKGCNPLYGTEIPDIVLSNGYSVNAFLAFHQPFCLPSTTNNITHLDLTGQIGTMTALLNDGMGVVKASFILPKINTFLQTGTLDTCGFVVGGTDPIVAAGTISYVVKNPVSVDINLSVGVSDQPPDPVTGLLDLNLLSSNTADNFILEMATIGSLSASLVGIPITAGVHYIQFFPRTLSRNCSVAFESSVDYSSTFVDNAAAYSQVSLAFVSSVLTNYSDADISTAKTVDNLINAIALKDVVIDNTVLTLQTDVSSVANSVAQIISDNVAFTDSINSHDEDINLVIKPSLVSLSSAVISSAAETAAIRENQVAFQYLSGNVSDAIGRDLNRTNTEVITLNAKSQAMEQWIDGNLTIQAAKLEEIEGKVLAAATALALNQDPAVFSQGMVGSGIYSTQWWTIAGAVFAAIAGLLGMGLGAYSTVKVGQILKTVAKQEAQIKDLNRRLMMVSGHGGFQMDPNAMMQQQLNQQQAQYFSQPQPQQSQTQQFSPPSQQQQQQAPPLPQKSPAYSSAPPPPRPQSAPQFSQPQTQFKSQFNGGTQGGNSTGLLVSSKNGRPPLQMSRLAYPSDAGKPKFT